MSVEETHKALDLQADHKEQMHGVEDDHEGSAFRLQTLCLPRTRFRKRATLYQKLAAEVLATFILVFSGAGAGMVNGITQGALSPFGVSAANGLVVMMMIYSTGHISGAHMNPAVTLAFATVRHFPWTQVPLYVGAQVTGSVSASFVLRQLFPDVDRLALTLPAGSVVQSLVVEILVTFILMFVVAAVSTDTRAVGELAGLAVGATVALNNIIAGPISGASMNPARSIGPAIAGNNFKYIWVYMVGPVLGTLSGAWSYNLIRTVERPGERSLSSSSFSSHRRSFNKRGASDAAMV